MKNMTKDETKQFWNTRSNSFPGYREGDTYQAAMIDLAKKHGIEFKDKSLIDIGCGSGSYAVRLAKEGAIVTALDISKGMLETLRNSAKDHNIKIECVESDWLDCDFDKKFDITFASLTPAIATKEAVAKMAKASRKWSIYITFAGKMRANILDGLFELHGREMKHSVFPPVVREWLGENNIKFSSYPLKGEWVTLRTREQMVENCIDVLKSHKIEYKMDIIKEFIEKHKNNDGMYESKTAYDVEMIIWENK